MLPFICLVFIALRFFHAVGVLFLGSCLYCFSSLFLSLPIQEKEEEGKKNNNMKKSLRIKEENKIEGVGGKPPQEGKR